MQGHFLQSQAWGNYSEREGRQVFYLKDNLYQLLAIKYQTPLGVYLYCPYGPAIDTKDVQLSFEQALEGLKKLAKEQNAFFVRIEPTVYFTPEALRKLGFKKSHDIDPANTWVIDLTQSEEAILKDIEKTKVRHWRNHEKKGLVVRQTQDSEQISILSNLLQGVGERDKFIPQDEAHLKKQLEAGFATLYVAEYEGKPIAASLVYDHDNVRYYAHAATDDEYRKLMAGTVLLVQMIIDAKRDGAEKFDFWGITTSDDPSHPWHGFTQYKKSFGGKQVDYSGTWDLPLRPFKYRFYEIFRRINRAKRKVK